MWQDHGNAGGAGLGPPGARGGGREGAAWRLEGLRCAADGACEPLATYPRPSLEPPSLHKRQCPSAGGGGGLWDPKVCVPKMA